MTRAAGHFVFQPMDGLNEGWNIGWGEHLRISLRGGEIALDKEQRLSSKLISTLLLFQRNFNTGSSPIQLESLPIATNIKH